MIRDLRKQGGFTIVELMVTMVIMVVVMGGVYKVFHSNWTNYRVQEGLSRLQENGRFAMNFLTRDVREAGYRGCISYGPLTNTLAYDPTVNLEDLAYNFDVGIEGFTAADLSWLPGPPISGSDILVIRTMQDNAVGVVKNNSSAQLFAEVTTTESKACANGTDRISGICEGDILMVTDCSKSRIFQAGNIQVTSSGGLSLNITHPASGTPGNSPSSWGGASAPESERFGTDAEIVKVGTITYYVRPNPAGQPALYRKIGASSAQEVAEGVEMMQVRYGEDTNGDRNADVYRVASDVADWSAVRSVRMGLLMRTANEVARIEPDDKSYNVLGASFGPYNDRRLRRVFTATVALRNRLP